MKKDTATRRRLIAQIRRNDLEIAVSELSLALLEITFAGHVTWARNRAKRALNQVKIS